MSCDIKLKCSANSHALPSFLLQLRKAELKRQADNATIAYMNDDISVAWHKRTSNLVAPIHLDSTSMLSLFVRGQHQRPRALLHCLVSFEWS